MKLRTQNSGIVSGGGVGGQARRPVRSTVVFHDDFLCIISRVFRICITYFHWYCCDLDITLTCRRPQTDISIVTQILYRSAEICIWKKLFWTRLKTLKASIRQTLWHIFSWLWHYADMPVTSSSFCQARTSLVINLDCTVHVQHEKFN